METRIICLLVFFLLAGINYPILPQYRIEKYVLGGGIANTSNEDFIMKGTTGQVLIGKTANSSNINNSGLWYLMTQAGINMVPLSLQFNYVVKGNSSTKEIVITNTGAANLQIDSIRSSNLVFKADQDFLLINPLGNKEIAVTFTPTDTFQYNGILSLYHNAPNRTNTISLSGYGFIYSNLVQLTFNQSFGNGDVSNTSNYRIVGMPGNVSIPIRVSGDYEYDWQVYWDNGNNENYLEQSADYVFAPGKAYWILSRNALSINQQVNTVTLNNVDYTYSIPLHPGWNLISTPFERNTIWESVSNLNGLQANNVLYAWNGTYSNTTEMLPYVGYYYHNTNSLTSLKIPYEPNSSLGKKQSEGVYPIDVKRFLKLFIKRENQEEMSQIFIGIDPVSKDGFDEKDYYAAPGDFQKESISLVKPELPKRNRYFFIEQRPEIGEGQEFDVEIKCVPNQSLEIEIGGTENFDKYNICLLDGRLKNLYNLKEKKRVELRLAHQYNSFKLYIGSNEYIDKIRKDINPISYELFQNYPNPFNPSTIIRFSLPEDNKITLKVFNILGEVLTTLVDNELYQAGSYEVEFNGKEYSSGVYIIRIDAEKFSSQKKIVLIK